MNSAGTTRFSIQYSAFSIFFGETLPMNPSLETRVRQSSEQLDAHVRETIQWHFNPETGSPFWLEWAKKAGLDPRKEVRAFADLKKFGHFEDEWLRGGPVNRWIPKGLAGKPA